jgi:hypothetical protein
LRWNDKKNVAELFYTIDYGPTAINYIGLPWWKYKPTPSRIEAWPLDGGFTKSDCEPGAKLSLDKQEILLVQLQQVKALRSAKTLGFNNANVTAQGMMLSIAGARLRGPNINVRHLFHGEINRRGRAVGFHHVGSIGHQGRARIVSIVDPADAQGVYRATVEVFDSSRGCWVAKGTPSTFFPDKWSRARVLNEVRSAFNNMVVRRGRYWEGVGSGRVRIGGYLDDAGSINTAFPIY